jgi:hypothetical protein
MVSVATAEVACAREGAPDDPGAADRATAYVGTADPSGEPGSDRVTAAAADVIRVADAAGTTNDDARMTGDTVATAMEAADDMPAVETTPVIPASVKATATPTEMPAPAATAVESAATATGMPTPAMPPPAAAAASKRSAWKDGERKRERCGKRENLRLGAHPDHRPHDTA